MNPSNFLINLPLQVGLVGTGYAAKLRAEALHGDRRTILAAVAGHRFNKTQEFSQVYGAEALESWHELIDRSLLDLVIVANVNRDHGAIVRAALQAGKHVIVEYPLSLDVTEAEELIALAKSQNKLLHVEHIELLGGMHQALKTHFSEVGRSFYARYATINPQHPAPQKWTYDADLFGFPLMGALSRLHRLTDLFGTVSTVSCQASFWNSGNPDLTSHYTACLCSAHLQFKNGVIAEVTYGKGEVLWKPERRLEVHGDKGALIFDEDAGQLIQSEGNRVIDVGTRRGLFAKDTTLVLDHLVMGSPLYIKPEESLYALRVADAARRSATTGQTIKLEEK